MKKLSNLTYSNNIKLFGPIYDQNELMRHYCQASVFCYPAQDDSGDAAPVAPREAMAYGCVPVVSELDCFNDFIIAGVNGLTYNQNSTNQADSLADALGTLMRNETMLKEMSTRATHSSKKYFSKTIATQFIKDFENL